MDLNHEGSESNMNSPTTEMVIQKKTCADCQTSKTPLWRSGPAGPRSLCNACGIRNRKQRRALLGLGKPGSDKIKKKKPSDSNSSSSSNSNEMGESLNVQRSSSWGNKKKKNEMGRKLMEEEEAAMLLMALSCGSVFA